jgi:hypothetical protein
MTRFLCFPLLFLFVMPLFAQEEPATLGEPFPRDPALLMRMREKVSHDLQQIQRMLGFVNPSDPHYEVLQTQQAELTKQLRDITQQMQAGPQSSRTLRIVEVPPGQPTALGGMPMIPPTQTRDTEWRMQEPTMPQSGMQAFPNPLAPMRPEIPTQVPNSQMPIYLPTPPNPYHDYGGTPNWTAQDRAWEAAHWGPRLPRELTEIKQSVETLRKEIGELKETIKVLETQIQLLSRVILSSEKVKENEN